MAFPIISSTTFSTTHATINTTIVLIAYTTVIILLSILFFLNKLATTLALSVNLDTL